MMKKQQNIIQPAYIEGVGGAYIDLDYIPTENTKFECCALFFKTSNFYHFGSISNQVEGMQYSRWHFGLNAGMLTINYNSMETKSITNDEGYHIYTLSGQEVGIDDNKQTEGISLGLNGLSLWLFDRNSDFETTQTYGQARVQYAKIYENNILVRNYIPYYHNGVYCMYETIQNKFYYNQGDGLFIGNSTTEEGSDDWDLAWNYLMSDPLDWGFTRQSGFYNPTMTQDGLYFNGNGTDLYGIYPTNYPNCNEGIYEIEAKIIRNNVSNGQGLRLQLTNGTEGVGIYMITNNIIQYDNGGQNIYIDIGSYNLNEWFKFRIELSNNTAYVYLNNNLIHQTTTLSKGYMTSGNRFLVQGSVECYVRSIRFKRIS